MLYNEAEKKKLAAKRKFVTGTNQPTLIKPCKEPGCPNLADDSIPGTGWCRRHYNSHYYLRDLERRAETNPSLAVKAIAVCLEMFERLRDFGVLEQLEFGYLQRLFIDKHQTLVPPIVNNIDTEEMIAADEAYRRQLLSGGALEFESGEEAKEIFKIAKQIREQMRQEKELVAAPSSDPDSNPQEGLTAA